MADVQELSQPDVKEGRTEKILHHIEELLESNRRKSRVELMCAIILSLATTCSAWCAYQSKLWSGKQGAESGAAGTAASLAAQNRLRGMTIRTMEAALFIKIFEAWNPEDNKVADFYTARLPPRTQAALKAWWKTKPKTNKDAPATPFAMAEYSQPELEAAEKLDKDAAGHAALSSKAGKNSDTYVLLTVMFASVLFFGGIGGTFSSRWLRRTMMYISLVLFLVTFTVLVMMPVGWD
jgi:hypothetical protein